MLPVIGPDLSKIPEGKQCHVWLILVHMSLAKWYSISEAICYAWAGDSGIEFCFDIHAGELATN